MKALFIKYKPVIKFIFIFLVVYVTLSVIYKLYLQYAEGSRFYPDYITNLVAKQTSALLNVLGYEVKVLPHTNELSMKVIVNGVYLARVIEGCNAVSVIILFMSFIAAFFAKLKNTLRYMFFGSVLIYIVNVLRIVVLTMGLYHYPQYGDVLHGVVFPAIIYGMVFLLWILWVNRFSKLKKKDA
ncbi:exosortase family protein XrtF [uncultured Algibacter sp.]|uniref:exosortase family protein XrtF n=1 Tax=uncultured Algibacter sp. TaxID=298659 RepID=UPI0032180018